MLNALANNDSSLGWQASLTLLLRSKALRTVLQSVKHYGPLRVQRPFYPEGEVCHLYLLHPPGGLVAGDSLTIDIELETQASALLTTPSAGKLYGVADYAAAQFQGVHARLAEHSCLEWLPQETIVFNAARGELRNRFELAAKATLIGWDIVCLGRRASGETFQQGAVTQRIEIYRQGKPLFIDRIHFAGGSAMLDAPWGMNKASVSGTFFATLGEHSLSLDSFRECLPNPQQWGLTVRGELLLVRYLGDSAESCRRGFEAIWQLLRPLLINKPVHRPRIWNT